MGPVSCVGVVGTSRRLAVCRVRVVRVLGASTTGHVLRVSGEAVIEKLGYHQLHLLFRIAGTFYYIVRRRKDVGATERYGAYQDTAAGPLTPPPA